MYLIPHKGDPLPGRRVEFPGPEKVAGKFTLEATEEPTTGAIPDCPRSEQM